MTGALAGLRVLEIASTLPTAFCGKLLADLGADVVKVEPPEGSPERYVGPFPDGRAPTGDEPPETSGRHLYVNTSKSSVVLDATTEAGRKTLADLIGQADVVVEDQPDLVAAVIDMPTTSLVWATITPFGLTGPYSGYVAEHLNLFHAGGEGQILPSGEGWSLFPQRPPIQAGSEVGHYDTGTNAATAILAAVATQRRTGRGERIDISAHECQVAMNRLRMVRFTHDAATLRRKEAPYKVGGMFHCADGPIQLLPTPGSNWQGLFETTGADALAELGVEAAAAGADGRANEALAGWCAHRTKADAVATLGGFGFAVGPYAVPEDLLRSPQLAHRGFFATVAHPDAGSVTLPSAPYQLSVTPVRVKPAPRLGSGSGFEGERLPTASDDAPHPLPLAGCRVLDFTWALAGPQTTLLLALFGAEVIKVETQGRIDVTRRGIGGFPYDTIDHAPDFNALNANKRSFRVDLRQERGLELIHQLLPKCDIVTDNFRPGVMAKFGLDPAALLERFPSLIISSSSGNGSSGPESRYAGFASIFGAAGGTSQQTGYADGPPTLLEESSDYRSGTMSALAVLAAVIHRQRTGQGQVVDMSSVEAMTVISPDALLAHVLGAPATARLGNRHATLAPHNVYPSATDPGAEHPSWCSIAVANDEQWRALCHLIGRDEWTTTYRTAAARKADEDMIDEAIATWTSRRGHREAFTELQAAGVPSAPSFTFAELANDPHLHERAMLADIDHPLIGTQRFMRSPWLMANTDAAATRHGPLLGQDNDYVLGELLGLDETQRAALSDVLI